MRKRKCLTAGDQFESPSPPGSGTFLRMRKIVGIRKGDWAALVKHVQAETRLRTGILASRAGVDGATWWRWEQGHQRPKHAHVVERFAEAFATDAGIEPDDAMWAAGMLLSDPNSPDEPDPRLEGLDENDEIVRHIMSLEGVDDDWRTFALNRYREIQAMHRKQVREALDLEVQQMHKRGRNDGPPQIRSRGAA